MSNIKRHFEKIIEDFEKEIQPKHPVQFKNMEYDVRLIIGRFMPEITLDEVAAFLEYLSAKIALTDEVETG